MGDEFMETNNLKDVLEECQDYTKRGYEIALKQEKSLVKTLNVAQKEIQYTLNNIKATPYQSYSTTQMLESQLKDINDSLFSLSSIFEDDLEKLNKNMSNFSITLFGRTMTGKSTLMEVLTEGDGKSIGNGSQRTTRDVRKYKWNGLEITDVPGIGAFEGQEDEEIAFEAAKSADLILFLITDDAPQFAEAECFSKIVNLGKPIICIMNVKYAILERTSEKLLKRDMAKKFDKDRLERIHQQFLAFSVSFNQTWQHIPFVYVHLQAAYLSQCTNDQERKRFLYNSSKISILKGKIIYQVQEKGKFYRIKNYIDIISNPTLELIEFFLDQSQSNSTQGRVILDKKRQLNKWEESFYRESMSQIESLIIKIRSELNSEIAAFAEEHFDDKNADAAWNRILKSKKIEDKCQRLLTDLQEKYNIKISQVSNEITKELQFLEKFSKDQKLKMDKVTNTKRIWDWSTAILDGGLGIGAIIATLLDLSIAGPLGWIAIAVGGIGLIGSFLFKSREKKEHDARKKLETNLKENIAKITDELENKMKKNFENHIIGNFKSVIREIEKINNVVFTLADTQRGLAWDLNDHLLELNKAIVDETIKMVGADGLQYHILDVARIPGNMNMFKLREGVVFPKKIAKALASLMSERIQFVFGSNNSKVFISRIIGYEVERSKIHIESKIGVAYVPMRYLTSNTKIRIRLAQQLSKLLIMEGDTYVKNS